MFELNHSIFDVFTIGHAALPCYIGWRLGQSCRWPTVTKPILILFALIATCEPVEMLLTAAGLQTFDETPINILGDIMVSIPFSLFGIYAGRRERERAQALICARRAAQKERLSPPEETASHICAPGEPGAKSRPEKPTSGPPTGDSR